MLWGDGQTSSTDAARLAAFEALNWNPPYIIGFEEPDCPAGSGSAGFDVSTGVQLWDQWMVPHGQGGSLLISPSMCMQASESGWLQPFQQQITRNWDITNVHINKNSAAGIELDLDHYWNTYGKPMWVTEVSRRHSQATRAYESSHVWTIRTASFHVKIKTKLIVSSGPPCRSSNQTAVLPDTPTRYVHFFPVRAGLMSERLRIG